jgi:hypothetical protein
MHRKGADAGDISYLSANEQNHAGTMKSERTMMSWPIEFAPHGDLAEEAAQRFRGLLW